MKIKNSFYCITDKYNKPDFRFLFESEKDAKKKIRAIKNSSAGETLFLSPSKRDFFIDGVKKQLIDPQRRIGIKKGCWTSLHVKELLLLDTVDPKAIFDKVVKAKESEYSYSKEFSKKPALKELPIKVPALPRFDFDFNWQTSILKTRTFLATLTMLCFITTVSVYAINQNTNRQLTREMTLSQKNTVETMIAIQTKLSGAKEQAAASQFDQDLNKFVLDTLKNFSEIKQDSFEQYIRGLLAGYPMEKMVPYIAQQDRTVAAFLIGIAKKESNFGMRVPVLNGQDCFNYWGYRGIRDRMGTGGHTCFNDPQDAVNTVAGRLKELVQADVDTPQEMSLWKCGSACAHDPGVGKWISDVNIYFNKVNSDSEKIPDNG